MTPMAACATAMNLLLATGPFTYPEGFVNLGPVTSSVLLGITCYIAYITATFMVEAISVAAARPKLDGDDAVNKSESEVKTTVDKQPIVEKQSKYAEIDDKDDVFHISEKIEVTIIA